MCDGWIWCFAANAWNCGCKRGYGGWGENHCGGNNPYIKWFLAASRKHKGFVRDYLRGGRRGRRADFAATAISFAGRNAIATSTQGLPGMPEFPRREVRGRGAGMWDSSRRGEGGSLPGLRDIQGEKASTLIYKASTLIYIEEKQSHFT
ncbi:hypothetical protein [Anabaena azotica]|uniref:Uncharacterized protein n=1 Tax=Anabaena azotica FACHB-119 TaxID=947527 RepID=A0ABR8DCJ5_9NOST|nr:hypothetical protein [Anabaena azotica]MBD2504854.1 hypothetical protein [Anabaena azotica FACHB-119]